MTDWQPDRSFDFTARLSGGAEATHPVHVRGEGPPILLLQELPGIGAETLHLVDLLADQGFSVWMPHFFGPLGRTSGLGNALHVLCVSREFHLFRTGRESPVADYLRALARHIRDTTGAPGIGVIGMCLTGHFALLMMAEDTVLAGVASQPSLPVLRPKAQQMSDATVQAARAGMAAKGPALVLHYQGDRMSSPTRVCAIAETFGTENVEVMAFPGKGHSVLTLHFRQEGFDRAAAYFRDRLGG